MQAVAGLFECRVCGHLWYDELPPLYSEWWPSCCMTEAWLLKILEVVGA